MKHYILAYPDKPYDEKLSSHQISMLLLNFTEHLKEIDLTSANGRKLPGGPVLLERQTADSVLGELFHLAEQCEMTLTLRFLSEH